jgi:hypothetical protein
MENSFSQDYVSEKLYDALIAGCVPIYWGAANVDTLIPHHSAMINYAALGSPSALQAELERLANNQTAYDEKLAWKEWPSMRWSPGEYDARWRVLSEFGPGVWLALGMLHWDHSNSKLAQVP